MKKINDHTSEDSDLEVSVPVESTQLRVPAPLQMRLLEISEWFPEVMADGVFDGSVIERMLRECESSEPRRFGLDWPGKRESIQLLRQPGVGTLLPRRLESLRFEEAQHVFITGENLEVMKLLQKAYYGSFKMIYLDPPYNTGGDLVYNDDYIEPLASYLRYSGQISESATRQSSLLETHGRFHSRWLSMMLPRLFAARNLLSESGVIFVSIDDHEVHHLRMLMDEVFGADNFVCSFVWEKRYAPPPDTKDVGYVHENILCYRRSDAFERALLPMTSAQRSRYKNPDNDPRGDWKAADYTCRYTSVERPNLYYPIRNPFTGKDIWPKKSRVWACSPQEHLKNEHANELWWGPTGQAKTPARKKFSGKIRQGSMPMTLLHHKAVGHTDEATKELRKWFPDLKVTPKPTRLLRHLIRIANVQAGDLVLDCFAGTGTMAEAVLNANELDDVGAHFVLIQLPEPLLDPAKSTMADIAQSRAVRRAKESPQPTGIRCFSLADSSFRAWRSLDIQAHAQLAEQLKLMVNNVREDRTEEELLFEVLLKAGFKLSSQIKELEVGGQRVFGVADNALLICLARTVGRDCIRAMESLEPERVVCLDIAFEGNDEAKTNTVLEMRSHGIEFRTI